MGSTFLPYWGCLRSFGRESWSSFSLGMWIVPGSAEKHGSSMISLMLGVLMGMLWPPLMTLVIILMKYAEGLMASRGILSCRRSAARSLLCASRPSKVLQQPCP